MKAAPFYSALLPALLSIFFAAMPTPGAAQTDSAVPPPKVSRLEASTPQRILFVGNSYLYYNDSIHNHVRRMVVAGDPSLEKSLQYKSATIGGAPLSQHPIEHLTTAGRLGVKEPFDVVVLQGNSAAALSETGRRSFHDAVVRFNGVIQSHGSKTALYMTHAYVAPHKKASDEMLRETAKMVLAAGNEVGALVIPVGLAFEEAYRRQPEIKLHKTYDGSHPDLIGSYLAACVVYASLYGKSPVGNSYDYYGKIDRQTAAFLQKVAQDTVESFFSK